VRVFDGLESEYVDRNVNCNHVEAMWGHVVSLIVLALPHLYVDLFMDSKTI